MAEELVLEVSPEKDAESGGDAIHGSDPLFRWLMRLTGGGKVLRSTALAVVVALPSFVAAVLEGVVVNPALRVGLLQDMGYWLALLTIPFFLPYSGSVYRYVSRLPKLLAKHGTVDEKSLHDNKALDDWSKWLKDKRLVVGIYLGSLALLIVQTTQGHLNRDNSWSWPDWAAAPQASAWLSQLMFGLSLYLIFQITVRVALLAWFTWKLPEVLGFRIRILHSDGCAGLKPIGDLSFRLNVLVFVAGLLVACTLYSQTRIFEQSIFHPMQIITLLGYLLVSSAIVFLPPLASHFKMKGERRRLLQELADRFDREHQKLRGSITRNRSLNADDVERLEKIKSYYDMANSQPIWPFNIGLIYTFLASVVMPIFFMVVQAYIERVFP